MMAVDPHSLMWSRVLARARHIMAVIMTDTRDNPNRRNLMAIVFALTYPTFLTIVYFILLGENPAGVQLVAFGAGKAVQFLFPVAWFFWIQRGNVNWRKPRAKDLITGAILGLALLVSALVLYFAWLKPAGLFDLPAIEIRKKISGFSVGTPASFTAVAIFYCAAHSLMEEYYWRWFVFGQLRRLTSLAAATVVSSLGFMSHHVFVLAVYFGWASPLTWLFSAAVAVGGVLWAWMYEKTGSLYGPWVCHALVDAAIFVVGWDLL